MSDDVENGKLASRVAVLEAQRQSDRDSFLGDVHRIEDHMHGMETELHALTKELIEFRRMFTRGRGFIAGVAAVVVPLWGIAASLVVTLWDKLTSGFN